MTNLCERGDFNDEFIRAVAGCERRRVGVGQSGAEQEGGYGLLPFGGEAEAEVVVGSGNDEDFFVLEREAGQCGGLGCSSSSSSSSSSSRM